MKLAYDFFIDSSRFYFIVYIVYGTDSLKLFWISDFSNGLV